MKKNVFPEYSCLMSVYRKEKAAYLKASIESILDQTIRPSEFLIVKDGELTLELEDVLEKFSRSNPGLFKFIEFKENCGLWRALHEGVLACSHNLIMRMDSDDYSEPERAAHLLRYMTSHLECACCGSNVDEFESSINNVVAHVVLPTENNEIVTFAQKRNPLRHPAMMYRKAAVLDVGNYQEMPFFEDYDLVLRLIHHGSQMHNLSEVLVRMRVDPSFYKRRGSFSYLKYMKRFRKNSLVNGYITRSSYLMSIIPHAVVCLLPNKAREMVYKKLLRK